MLIKTYKIIPETIFLYLIFLLLPLYVFGAGQLQLVDGVIFFLFLYYCFKGSLTQIYFGKKNIAFSLVIILLFFQLLVLSYHGIFSNENDTWLLILDNFYYIILLFIFILMFQNLYRHYPIQKVYNILLNGLIIAFIVPMGKLLLFGGSDFGGREMLSFNDPNQLVFFSLMSLTILYYITLQIEDFDVHKNKFKSVVVLALNLVVLVLSASRTGLVLLILYVAIFLRIFNLRNIIKNNLFRRAVIFLITCFFLVYIYFKVQGYISLIRPDALSTSVVKKEFFTRAISGLQMHIYDMRYFLLGAGTKINPTGKEFHDNFVGIFYQTGIFALILYIVFCWTLLISAIKKKIHYGLPVIMYILVSLSLYAFRTRFWWLLLAFMIVVITKSEVIQKNNNLCGDLCNDENYANN